jgi:hypothetical protein
MRKKILILLLLLNIVSSQFLLAQDNLETETSKTDDSWTFSVTPYLWMTSLKGDLTVINQNIPVDLNFSEDLLSNLKMAAMVHAEVKKNKVSFMIDAFYAKLGVDGQRTGVLNRTKDVRLRVKETMFEGGLGYTFAQTGGFSMDALVGLRYFNVNNNVQINDIVIADKDINFLDPYVGVRLIHECNKWIISGRADIGGFDIGSDHSYKVNGLVSYKFSKSFVTSVGYQLYKPDYQKDNFRYNLANEGFLLGFTFVL